jgi:hypothetical protein
MTDFFDDLERELRRAHRRDTERHARARVTDSRWLPRLPAAGLRTLAALAVVLAIVAVVLSVGQKSGVDRPTAAPPPGPTPGALDGCLPSELWEPPIVDEPIPREIASRFAILRDHARRSGELPRDARIFSQARKLYRGAVTIRPRLDAGTRIRVVVIAADTVYAQRDHDFCAPPQDPILRGLCVAAFAPNGTKYEGKCFPMPEIAGAQAWFAVTPHTVFGLAPDGVKRVTFDTPAGTQSLNISGNVFAGEIRSAGNPSDTNSRFERPAVSPGPPVNADG